MDDLLEKAKKAVDKFHSKQSGDKMKGTKVVLSAVQALKKYIEENEREDRGIAQRCARELSEILSSLPLFRNFAHDKKALNNIHTKKLADEHLDSIQTELENVVKEMNEARKKKVKDWVRSHPVLGKLRRSASKRLPEGAYVLLFRRSSSHVPAAQREGAGKHRKHGKNSGQEQQQGSDAAVLELSLNQAQESGGVATATAVSLEVSSTVTLTCEQNESFTEVTESMVQTVVIHDQEETADAVAESAESSSETEKETETSEDGAATSEPTSTEPAPNSELVLRPSADGRIFTRFRPKEFVDETRVYRMFRGGPPIVGACIIADGKLANAFGSLPEPPEGGDQLRLLLSISKEAVGKPGRSFVESHYVLNELFSMCKSRQVHKEAYILLFQLAEEKNEDGTSKDATEAQSGNPVVSDELPPEEESAESPGSEDLESATAPESATEDESATTEEAVQAEAVSESAEEKAELEPEALAEQLSSETNPESAQSANTENPTQSEAESETDQEADAESDAESDSESESDSDAADLDASSDSSDDDDLDDDEEFTGKLELVEKKSEEGRIITRYRTFDFIDSRTVFEGFKNRKPIVGAAIIRERELIKVIGKVPQNPGERQLDTLLNYSRQALDKPALEFINASEILNGLYEIANNPEFKQKDGTVVLFTDDAGRPSLYSSANKRGKAQVRLPISDFKSPKFVHDRFKAEKPIIGASIIGEQVTAPNARETVDPRRGGKPGGNQDRDRGRDQFRRNTPPPRRLVVFVAFGRTPLKQNILLSEEILKRIGVDVAILEEPEFDRDRGGDRYRSDRSGADRSGGDRSGGDRSRGSRDGRDRNNNRDRSNNRDRNQTGSNQPVNNRDRRQPENIQPVDNQPVDKQPENKESN